MDKDKANDSKPKKDERTQQQRRNSLLDEAMEPIFHPVTERFSLADLGSGKRVERNVQYDENDYQSHRKESLHHHQPLHRLYHKHRKSSHKVDQDDSPVDPSETEQENEDEPNSTAPLLEKTDATLAPMGSVGGSEEKVQFYVGSSVSIENAAGPSSTKSFSEKVSSAINVVKSPLKSVLRKNSSKKVILPTIGVSPSLTLPSGLESSRENFALKGSLTDGTLRDLSSSSATVLQTDSPSVPEKLKVTFTLGEEVNDEQTKVTQPISKKNHRHSKRYHKRYDPMTGRNKQGSDLESKQYNDILEPEEAETLQSADIDDMASHRFDDPKGIRRHKIRDKGFLPSFGNLLRGEGSDGYPLFPMKKLYDHQPHEIFVELDELLPDEATNDLIWRETARWIKYEEDIEEGADRWGKPHVASLCFHSLLNLRKCLESGSVILDLEQSDFVGIVNKIVDSMVMYDQIKIEQRTAVVMALLLRHRHANDKYPHGPFLRRNSSGYGNLNMLSNDKNKSPMFFRGRSRSEHGTNQTLNRSDTASSAETSILMPLNASISRDIQIMSASMRNSISNDDVTKLDTGILRRIPHNAEGTAVLVGALDFLVQSAVAFVRLSEGRIIPHLLEVPIPTRFIFLLLGPLESEMDYHEIGRSISTLMSDQAFHDAAYRANDRTDLLSAINEFLDNSVVMPPGDWGNASLLPMDQIRRKSLQFRKREEIKEIKEAPDITKTPAYNPLKRTGRCFGGFTKDIKNRYPWYISDIVDGLNAQCLASTIFIYFAAISGAITFGGLLGEKTHHLIGVSETLIVTSVCGIIYSFLSCQPLLILGTTGPMLLFDEMLFQFCNTHEMNFLLIRVWISFWTAIISTVVVALEGSSLVRFFSRFMQEIFATIISLIFIVEALGKLYKIFKEHPLKSDYCTDTGLNNTLYNNTTVSPQRDQPNTALLSTILMIGTFYIALFLRHFRNSKFLGRSARRALGDFGVPIAIAFTVLIDVLIKDTYTQKLNVPEGLTPSDPSVRGWVISPWPVTVLAALGASIGGLLIFILLFIETQICELIVSKKERKTKKGSGFHVDMMLISYMEIGCAVMGGPWLCAATVRSISHLSSLTVWSKTHAPGTRPHIVEIKEQRLSNLCVSLLVGISVLMAPLLRLVPVAVLFGVFLYMGVSSLNGIELFERILLIFMPTKHHPDVPFVTRVRTWKMHLYTAIQIVCIAVLWGIKSSILAPAFPFGLLTLVFVHRQMKCCFSPEELRALDDEEPEEYKTEEPDFYEQIVA